MFTEMINNLCLGDTKKIEKLDFIFLQVCFKGKFTKEEMIQMMHLGIMHGNELKAICGCDFNTFVMIMYERSIKKKEIIKQNKTNPFELLMFIPLFFVWIISAPFVLIFKKIKESRK